MYNTTLYIQNINPVISNNLPLSNTFQTKLFPRHGGEAQYCNNAVWPARACDCEFECRGQPYWGTCAAGIKNFSVRAVGMSYVLIVTFGFTNRSYHATGTQIPCFWKMKSLSWTLQVLGLPWRTLEIQRFVTWTFIGILCVDASVPLSFIIFYYKFAYQIIIFLGIGLEMVQGANYWNAECSPFIDCCF